MNIRRLITLSTNSFVELGIIYASMIGIAALAFSFSEARNYGDSLWWALVTATTTGYGDISPVTPVGRITGVILMHVSLFIVVPLIIARIAITLIENPDHFSNDEQEQMKADIAAIKAALIKESPSDEG